MSKYDAVEDLGDTLVVSYIAHKGRIILSKYEGTLEMKEEIILHKEQVFKLLEFLKTKTWFYGD